jgi:hypothetical protein
MVGGQALPNVLFLKLPPLEGVLLLEGVTEEPSKGRLGEGLSAGDTARSAFIFVP